ncbi:MAG: threonylcarbamoyl-AMP synthase [Chloroflexi bacterium]|nr:threonylcarbamoyl-AMP synthase [Chloroflexota bacterium]
MTIVLSAQDPNAIAVAGELLNDGQLAIIPTDTVYGLAARLTDDAILRLYVAKQRPPDKATPILLASLDDIELVTEPLPPAIRRIATTFWPGPLTLVLPKRDGLPQRVSGVPTVGVRVPDNPITRAVIKAAGGALAVTSANCSGKPVGTTVQEALEQLGDSVSMAIDAGVCKSAVASTVAAIDGRTVRVVREGPISAAQLEEVMEDKPRV